MYGYNPMFGGYDPYGQMQGFGGYQMPMYNPMSFYNPYGFGGMGMGFGGMGYDPSSFMNQFQAQLDDLFGKYFSNQEGGNVPDDIEYSEGMPSESPVTPKNNTSSGGTTTPKQEPVAPAVTGQGGFTAGENFGKKVFETGKFGKKTKQNLKKAGYDVGAIRDSIKSGNFTDASDFRNQFGNMTTQGTFRR